MSVISFPNTLSNSDDYEYGEDFAQTIAVISSGAYVPQKKEYPEVKKVFWEESKYNPSLLTKDQDYGAEYYQREQSEYWGKKGHKWNEQQRFLREIPVSERGPKKAPEYEHCFETPERYWGRERQVRPFARARLYQCPVERFDPSIVAVLDVCLSACVKILICYVLG